MKRLLLLLLSLSSFGYENMIVKGYSSCIACHKSSTGGGLLTSYGKHIASTGSVFNSKNLDPSTSNFNYALQFRYANLEANGVKRNFPMQADILTGISFKEMGEVYADLARAPESQAIASGIDTPKQTDLWFFRKFLYEYKDLFVGRERFNLGVNIVDHTTLNKSLNRMNVNDLVTSLGFKSVSKNSTYRVFAYGPSFQEKDSNKEYGVALDYRRYINSNINIGSFTFLSEGKTIDRFGVGVNLKASLSKFLLLYEGVYSNRGFQDGSALDQRTNLFRLSFIPHMSVELFSNYELAHRNKEFNLDETRLGLGGRLKVWKWISLQYDYKNIERNNVEEEVSIAQLFLNIWG
jgi:hypothetical protein